MDFETKILVFCFINLFANFLMFLDLLKQSKDISNTINLLVELAKYLNEENKMLRRVK